MNKLLLTTTLCLLFASPAVADGSQGGQQQKSPAVADGSQGDQQQKSRAVASSDNGVPSANPDNGVPSANPDNGVPSANPDNGGVPTAGLGGDVGTTPTPPVGGNPAGITKVNQLTAQLANVTTLYHLSNYNKKSYAYYRMTRLIKQLAAAKAAEAAGTPQAPVLTENGQVMAVPSIY